MKSSKKLVILLFIVLMVLSGCTSKGDQSSDTTVRFWMTPPGEVATKEFWDKTVDQFNKENEDGLTVELEYVPEDAMKTRLKAAQAEGKAPEVVYINTTDAITKGKFGELMPINEFVSKELIDDLLPNIKQLIETNDGSIYNIPMFVEPYNLLFYRKDILEDAGVDTSNMPKTYAELLDVAEKVTNADRFGLGIPGTKDVGWVNLAFMITDGWDLVNSDWSEATSNTDKTRAHIEFFKEAYDRGVVPQQPLSDFWNIQPLVEGRLAMQMNGSWAISNILNEYRDQISLDQIGIALMPTADGTYHNGNVATLGGYGLGIDGKAKNPEAAGKFIEFVLKDNSATLIEFFESNSFSKLPVSETVIKNVDNNEVTEKGNIWYEFVIDEVVPHSGREAVYPWDIKQFFANAMEEVLFNGKDISTALGDAEKEINDFINQNQLSGTNPLSE